MIENEDKLINNNLKRSWILKFPYPWKYLLNACINLKKLLEALLLEYIDCLNMKFISENQISAELVNSFDEEMTLELAKRLEEDNYNTPFDGLKDWHLLRALAINRPELTTNYTHLLDQEPFDEN